MKSPLTTDKYILDDKGNPVPCYDFMKWAKWLEEAGEKRILKQTTTKQNYFVSTVFLALDHSFGGEIPILYESMVFDHNRVKVLKLPNGSTHNYHPDIYIERHADKESAYKGHEAILEMIKKGEI